MESNADIDATSAVSVSEDREQLKNDTETHNSQTQDASMESTMKKGINHPPRLIITKMILENFKSYAGVKEIGPFHKCFSCVVGPNGSGKSNVIDAMLFVFGKRAKKLRLNKVSELIHSSETYKDSPLQYARVSVYFQEIIDTGDGQKDYIVVPNTEIVVTRVAKRDNTSNYRLNDKSCSFKDVATYLESKGIDLDNNRFLILQGEVEMISMMPPRGKADNDSDGGLLEYLEDIIGSNVYVERTNECAKKLETLSEQRQEKFNRSQVALKEKDSLEPSKAEAEALLNKKGEIRRKKNILYQLNISQIQRDLDETQNKSEEIQQQVGMEKAKNKETDDRMKEIEGLLSSKQAEYDELHAELVKTKEEFAAFERKDVSLREDIKHAKETKKKFESKVSSENKKVEESSAKADAAEQSIPNLEGRIKNLEQTKIIEDEKLSEIFEQMKGTTEALRRDLEKKTQELAPISQERVFLQAALDTAETEQKLLEDMTTRTKDQLSSAEKELATIDSVQDSKRNELATAENDLKNFKQRLIDAEKEDEILAKEEEELMKKSNELLIKVEEAKAALQALAGMNKAVASILKAAQPNGELCSVGILGRLGDLATIDSKYDVAISTACGMLDHIVVHTTAGAQRCLDFLRRHNLGRASFIPLDKAPKGAHDRVVETPEGAPRLFDLITPTNFTATPALFLGVGNTLVSSDLETATHWAFDFNKRWRVVTLDGNLIESSGTMQGGGNQVKRGGMKLNGRSQHTSTSNLQTQEDSDKLEIEVKAAQEKLKKCRDMRTDLRDELRKLNKHVKELSVNIPKLNLQVISCDNTRSELTKIIPELREQCVLSVSDEQKLAELKAKVSKAKCDMATCTLKASKMESEVARLQKAIVDAGGSILKNQQIVCERALSELNQAVKELNGAKVTISSCRNASNKAIHNRAVAEKELLKCERSFENLMNDLNDLDKDAMDVKISYEEVKKLDIEKHQELDVLHAEYEDLKKVHSKMKCNELELMSKYDQCTKAVKEYEKNIHLWEVEISKLNDELAADSEYDAFEDEDEEHDTGRAKKLPVYGTTALSNYDVNDIKREILVLEKERDVLAKNANMGAIAEYRKKEEDYLARVTELDEATEARNEARKEHEELRRLRLEKFMDGFGQITLKLKEMYQMITLGGDAELELVDSLDPFSEGIVFSVRPPKKSWKNISNLSGGEKTLSSLALVFALHHYKPTPLYVMDEIDAALDFKNVSIVANYIKDRTKNAQFIIVSLRNNMFELADRLVGIYKTKNCTKSVTIDPKAFCDIMAKKLLPFGDTTNMNSAPSISLPYH